MSHVFVIRGDITHLACDAWMLPTSAALGVKRWAQVVDSLHARVAASDTAGLRSGRELAAVLAPGAERGPHIVLTAVPPHGFSNARALAPAVEAFFRVAVDATGRTGATDRPPLIAMPFFGTRGGGGATRKGEILDVLLARMRECSERYRVDSVLVLLDDAEAYALAQAKRSHDRTFFRPELSEVLLDHVQSLAGDARSGRLVPFMGAGVSVSAGGPTWRELIERLAVRLLGEGPAMRSLLEPHRDALDQATALRASWDAHQPSGGPTFPGLVADEVGRAWRYGLAPALLAALPANEAVTLNYDSLFERAATDAGRPRRVIPRADEDRGDEADQRNERWLLKLHGSVDAPSTIVLTRDDYLGYDQDRGALSSLVKAMLMTRHLLFVGFGLADDHFHEILHDVRRALADQGAGALDATVLKLREDPLDELLWQGQLDLIPLGDHDDSDALAGRRLEIFLDALLCFASTDHSYLLRDGFERALTDPELRLRRSLERLRESADEEVRQTPAWEVVEAALRELGG